MYCLLIDMHRKVCIYHMLILLWCQVLLYYVFATNAYQIFLCILPKSFLIMKIQIDLSVKAQVDDELHFGFLELVVYYARALLVESLVSYFFQFN